MSRSHRPNFISQQGDSFGGNSTIVETPMRSSESAVFDMSLCVDQRPTIGKEIGGHTNKHSTITAIALLRNIRRDVVEDP